MRRKGARKDLLPVPPAEPHSELLRRSHRVLSYAHESAKHLLNVYDELQKRRHGGAPTTEEQDLLRAMVVMAGAGLDATLKQLAKDALGEVVRSSDAARNTLVEFLDRKLKRGGDESGLNVKVLLQILVGGGGMNPTDGAVDVLRQELMQESMQSYEQLRRIVRHFGLDDTFLRSQEVELRSAFKVRNEVVHEMDMQADAGRVRRPRRRREMVEKASVLLKVAGVIVNGADQVLKRRT